MNTPPPTPVEDPLARYLSIGLTAAAGQAASSADARRRIDHRIRLRRRRAAGRRAGAVLAVAAVGVAGVAANRRPNADDVSTGVPLELGSAGAGPGTSPSRAPAADETVVPARVVPRHVPPGFRLAEASVRPDPAAVPVEGWFRLGDGPVVARSEQDLHVQFFRRGPEFGARPSVSVAVIGPDTKVPASPLDGDRTVTAGPHTLDILHVIPTGISGAFADGPRQVRLQGSDDLADDTLIALVGSLRWDEAAGRYRSEGDAGGMVEIPAPEAGAAGDRKLATVRLRRPGMTDVMIETHLGAPVGTVDAIAATPGARYRSLEVGGRRAVIDDPGDHPAQAVFILIPWPDGSYTEIRTFSLLDRPADPPPGFGVSVGMAEVLAVAASLHSVDQATWDALPKG